MESQPPAEQNEPMLPPSTNPATGRLGGLDVSHKSHRTLLGQRRSRIVRKLRWILPFLALVMMLIIVTWDEGSKQVKQAADQFNDPAPQTAQNELLKPVFNSVDEQNQPYQVTADKAIQNRTNPDIMDLMNPAATLTQKDGKTLEAQAQKGLYEQKKKKLNLMGDVALKTSEGYTLKTQELRVDIPTRKSYSDQDVTVEGDLGTLTAKGLEGDANMGVLTFTGPATIKLRTQGNLLRPADQPQDQTP